jgi:VanZ family protein
LRQLTVYEKRVSRAKRLWAWLGVGLMMSAILLTLPMMPLLWEKGVAVFGTGLNSIGYIVSFLLLFLLIMFMLRHRKNYGPLKIAALAMLGFVYGYVLRYQCKFPAERLHLVEYGFLAFLIYYAFSFDFSHRVSLLFAFLFSSGFGVFDECIQYLLPNRKFEMRDIMTNVIASILGMLVIALLIRTKPDEMLSERRT